MGLGAEEGLCFDGDFLEDRGRLLQLPPTRLFGGYKGPFEKWWLTDCCTQQSSTGFWTLCGSKYAI